MSMIRTLNPLYYISAVTVGRCFNSVVPAWPHTATVITKLEVVQRMSARWAIRDYQRTSSVTQMIKVLNWRTLEQQRIDSRLILIYKITGTYDLVVAIPAADYLIPNTRQSRHNHQLAYSQRLLQEHSFPTPKSTGTPPHLTSLLYLLWHNSLMLCVK